MSHIATVEVELADKDVLKQTCDRLGYAYREGIHTVRLYSGEVDAEFSVKLPGWNYPIAIVGKQVKFDNYSGKWGDASELTKLQDQYSRDITIKQANAMGMSCSEEVSEDGITLTLIDYGS